VSVIREMLADLELAHDRGLVEPAAYLQLRRDLWRFALTQTQAMYAKERCELTDFQRKKYLNWLQRRAGRLQRLLRTLEG
jgi:hypothetical protein